MKIIPKIYQHNMTNLLLNNSLFGQLLFIKIVFVIFILIFLGMIISILRKSELLKRIIFWDFQEITTYRHYGIRKIVKSWQKTRARIETGMESEYKLAVIEADSLLDEVLKKMGYPGESLGERLESLTAVSLPNLEEAKETHKTRNNIVHDPDYRLSLDEAKKTLEVYERALTDLQAL